MIRGDFIESVGIHNKTLDEFEIGQAAYAEKPVVDVETQNLLREVEWDPTQLSISVVGVLYKDKVTQYVLLNPKEDDQFVQLVTNKLRILPKPLVAFNKEFDRKVLKGNKCGDYVFEEVQAYKYEKKQEAKQEARIDFPDPYRGDGRKAVWDYRRYIETGDSTFLDNVVKHNLCCLVTESILYNLKRR